jgi:DNA-binding CsgD family transcriptional regulator
VTFEDVLDSLGAHDTEPPIDFNLLPTPAYIVDRNATVRWLNPPGVALFGEIIGRPALRAVEPRFRDELWRRFVKIMLGTANSNRMELIAFDSAGDRVHVQVNATLILGRDGAAVGTFGVIHLLARLAERQQTRIKLSARQETVLRMLAAGSSTEAMAEDLGLTRTTVRNHVNALLRKLGAHSRVEAVAVARAHGLLDD